MNNLAPIGLSVYKRLDHLRQAIAALQNNILAQHSELYIFSDAAQSGDEDDVAEVRAWLPSITGFLNTHIIERASNLQNENVIRGMKQLTDRYGKCIWVEDDIITAPGFLTFMNEALEFYRDDETVFSITGYMPPIKIPPECREDIIASYRMSSWGFGIFQRTIEPIYNGISEEKYHDQKNKNTFHLFSPGIFKAFEDDINGITRAFETRAIFHQTIHKMITIHPRQSLVNNIGNDGTGVRMPSSNRYYIQDIWSKRDNFALKKNLVIHPTVRRRMSIFWRGGLKAYIKSELRRFLINKFRRKN